MSFSHAVLLSLSFIGASAQASNTPNSPTPSAQTASPEPGEAVDSPIPIRDGVVPPSITHLARPKFSREERADKFDGTVKVYCWVEKDGRPSHVKVVQEVGRGFDEKAVETVKQYRFKPAMKNGKPVTVELQLEINFRIY